MTLYDMIDSMKVFASDFDIEREEIGLGYNMKEVLLNLPRLKAKDSCFNTTVK